MERNRCGPVLFASALALLCCARTPAGSGPGDARAPRDVGSASAAPEPTGPAAKSGLPRGIVRFDTPRGPWIVAVEIARTDESRQRGMMFRREIPTDTGMLFILDETSEHTFWMHNCELPLDMIFLGEDRSVACIVPQAEPHTDSPRSCHKPSRYVVEVLGGEAAVHAVGPGTRLTFIDVQE